MQITSAAKDTKFPLVVSVYSRNPKVAGVLPSFTKSVEASITAKPGASQLGEFGFDWTFTGHKTAYSSARYVEF